MKSRRCNQHNCEHEARGSRGMCYMHYKRYTDGRDMDSPRVIQNHDGRSEHSLYRVYMSMIGRCYTKKHTAYKSYGAKGITVCDRWLDKKDGFWNFVSDMGDKPSPKHTVDRIDSTKEYSPDNCRWGNQYLQAQNKRKCLNRLGYHGLRMHRGRYQAYHNIKNKLISLGIYDTIDEAILARKRIESSNDALAECARIKEEYLISRFKRSSGWRQPNGKWQMSISISGKREHLGTFSTQEEAIKERDLWITKNLKRLFQQTTE